MTTPKATQETHTWPELAIGLYDKLTGRNAEITAFPHGMGVFCRRYQRLRRDTPVIEAVAAHLALFQQHHVDPEGRRSRGHR